MSKWESDLHLTFCHKLMPPFVCDRCRNLIFFCKVVNYRLGNFDECLEATPTWDDITTYEAHRAKSVGCFHECTHANSSFVLELHLPWYLINFKNCFILLTLLTIKGLFLIFDRFYIRNFKKANISNLISFQFRHSQLINGLKLTCNPSQFI